MHWHSLNLSLNLIDVNYFSKLVCCSCFRNVYFSYVSRSVRLCHKSSATAAVTFYQFVSITQINLFFRLYLVYQVKKATVNRQKSGYAGRRWERVGLKEKHLTTGQRGDEILEEMKKIQFLECIIGYNSFITNTLEGNTLGNGGCRPMNEFLQYMKTR